MNTIVKKRGPAKQVYSRRTISIGYLPTQQKFFDLFKTPEKQTDGEAFDRLLGTLCSILNASSADAESLKSFITKVSSSITLEEGVTYSVYLQQMRDELQECPRSPNKKPKTSRRTAKEMEAHRREVAAEELRKIEEKAAQLRATIGGA